MKTSHLFLGVLLSFLLIGCSPDSISVPSPTPLNVDTPLASPVLGANRTQATVTSVTDGDTFKVLTDGNLETIRVIGIDTPEIFDPRKPVQCYGKEASAYSKQLLSGKTVYLETDQTQDDRDKYKRLLRFVFLEDGSDFGLTLIREGYANEYTYDSNPYYYQAEYKKAQTEARENNRGLWNPNACPDPTPAPWPPTPERTAKPVVITTPRQTVKPTIKPDAPAGKSCTGPDLDCSDFATHAQAQAFFEKCGWNAQNDPMKLDSVGVGNGLACESRP